MFYYGILGTISFCWSPSPTLPPHFLWHSYVCGRMSWSHELGYFQWCSKHRGSYLAFIFWLRYFRTWEWAGTSGAHCSDVRVTLCLADCSARSLVPSYSGLSPSPELSLAWEGACKPSHYDPSAGPWPDEGGTFLEFSQIFILKTNLWKYRSKVRNSTSLPQTRTTAKLRFWFKATVSITVAITRWDPLE